MRISFGCFLFWRNLFRLLGLLFLGAGGVLLGFPVKELEGTWFPALVPRFAVPNVPVKELEGSWPWWP